MGSLPVCSGVQSIIPTCSHCHRLPLSGGHLIWYAINTLGLRALATTCVLVFYWENLEKRLYLPLLEQIVTVLNLCLNMWCFIVST